MTGQSCKISSKKKSNAENIGFIDIKFYNKYNGL